MLNSQFFFFALAVPLENSRNDCISFFFHAKFPNFHVFRVVQHVKMALLTSKLRYLLLFYAVFQAAQFGLRWKSYDISPKQFKTIAGKAAGEEKHIFLRKYRNFNILYIFSCSNNLPVNFHIDVWNAHLLRANHAKSLRMARYSVGRPHFKGEEQEKSKKNLKFNEFSRCTQC